MHKKAVVIIAIIAGLLIIASGVVGTILILNPNKANQSAGPESSVDIDPLKQEEQTTPDLSVELGACTAVSHDDIANALSPMITEVRDANNRGFGYEGNGDKSQSCVYAFSAENNLSNRLTVTVVEFKDETNKANAAMGLEDNTAVSGIGDKAAFSSQVDTDVLKQHSYSLFVIIDMKQYALTILQPSDSDKFTAETAQTALETIAKSIE